jgi:hypothetical protein
MQLSHSGLDSRQVYFRQCAWLGARGLVRVSWVILILTHRATQPRHSKQALHHALLQSYNMPMPIYQLLAQQALAAASHVAADASWPHSPSRPPCQPGCPCTMHMLYPCIAPCLAQPPPTHTHQQPRNHLARLRTHVPGNTGRDTCSQQAPEQNLPPDRPPACRSPSVLC